MMQKYRSQDIANDLQTIVSELGSQIAPFALSFIQSLYKFYFNTIKCEDEISKEDFSNQDCPSAASMCLKFITIILQYPLEQHVIVQSQSMVIELIQSVFLTYPQDIGAALILLKAYLLKAQLLNERLFFFYQITIFNLIGDSFMKFQSFAMELEQRYACLLDKVRKNNNIEMFEQSFQPIRIYISKVSLMALENNYEIFKNRLICRLFHLINESYKMGRQMYIGNINIALSTSLMMSLLQNFKYSLPKNIYVQIWEFSKINMIKYQSRKLKSINSQLFGILLSLEPQIILNIVQRQNMMQNAMRLITTLNYDYSYERTGIIEGINQILLLQDKPAFIMSFIKDLFMANLRLVRQNIDQYLQIQRVEEQQDVSQSQDVRQSRSVNQDNSSDLDHQWWEQSAFQGRLQDENVCLFRFEEILLSISNEENDLSKDLIRSVPEQNIAILKHKFQLLRLHMSQENHNK